MSKVYESSVPNDFRGDEGSDSSDAENNVSQVMDYRMDSNLSLAMPLSGAEGPNGYLHVKQESDDSDGAEGLSPIPRTMSKSDSQGDDSLDQQQLQYDKKGTELIPFLSLLNYNNYNLYFCCMIVAYLVFVLAYEFHLLFT